MKRHTTKGMLWFAAALLCSCPVPAHGQTASPTQSTSKAGNEPVVNVEEPTPSPAKSRPTRKFTWAEIETILDKLRGERKGRPQAFDDLQSWYSYLSSPEYTESKDIPTHIAKLAEWREQFPKSPTPLVVLAKTYLAYGWAARGPGFANTVTEEGWKLLNERINEADKLIRDAVQMGVKDGEAYALCIEIAKAKGLPLNETRRFVEDGCKLDPSYVSMYAEMGVYLLPRWHGEPGDTEKFAAEVLKMVPGDDGLDAYGHIAYEINKYDYHSIFWGGFDRKALAQAAEVMVKRFPDARNLPCFAALCTVAAQDHAAARRIRPFVRYEDAPRVTLWKYVSKDYFAWCEAADVPSGEEDWVWGSFSSVRNLAFSPDSSMVFCNRAFAGQGLVLLDPRTKMVRGVLDSPRGGADNFVFEPKKDWVLSAVRDQNSQGWTLWDLRKPEKTRTFPTPDPCTAVAINPREPQIAWAVLKTIYTFDMERVEEGPKIELNDIVRDLKFSADGVLLAAKSQSSTSVWDAATGQKKYDVLDELPKIRCERILDFDEEGRIYGTAIASGSQSVVRFSSDGKKWDRLIADLGPDASYLSAVLSPDRQLLAVPERSRNLHSPEGIQIWDMRSGKKTNRLDGHWNHVGTLAFSPDGKKLASIGLTGGAIKIWRVEAK